MAARSRVRGEFGLGGAPQLRISDCLASLAFGILFAVLASWLLTTWFAVQLGHRASLGAAWLHWGQHRFYAPWSWWIWRSAIEQHYPSSALITSTAPAVRAIAALSMMAAGVTLLRRYQRRTSRAHELHGSAHFARPDEVQATGLLTERRARPWGLERLQKRPAREGVVLGHWLDPRTKTLRLLRDCSTRHVLVIAPPRSGKGVGNVIPTLLTCKDSVVVNDPKGELWRDTAGYRHSLGHRVFRWAPASTPGNGSRWNPLAEVRLGTAREVADTQQIATVLLDDGTGKSTSGENGIWTMAARSPLCAAILHVLYRAEHGGASASLRSVIDELKSPEHSYEDVMREWLGYPHDPTYKQGWRLPDGLPTKTHPLIAATAQAQLDLDAKVRSSVLFTLRTALEIYEDHCLADNLSASDFQLEELITGPTPATVYVVYPMSDIVRLGPVLRLLYEMLMLRVTENIRKVEPSEISRRRSLKLFRRAERSSDQQTTSHHKQHRLLLLLDEFPNLGRIRAIQEALPVCPGYGVRVVAVIQGYEQLRHVYGRDETISSVMHTRVAYTPNTLDTAKALSEMTGKATVIKTTPRKLFGRKHSTTSSEAEQEIARPLLTPDECMRLPGPTMDHSGERIEKAGNILVFNSGAPVIYGKQLLFWEDPRLLARTRIPAPATALSGGIEGDRAVGESVDAGCVP